MKPNTVPSAPVAALPLPPIGIRSARSAPPAAKCLSPPPRKPGPSPNPNAILPPAASFTLLRTALSPTAHSPKKPPRFRHRISSPSSSKTPRITRSSVAPSTPWTIIRSSREKIYTVSTSASPVCSGPSTKSAPSSPANSSAPISTKSNHSLASATPSLSTEPPTCSVCIAASPSSPTRGGKPTLPEKNCAPSGTKAQLRSKAAKVLLAAPRNFPSSPPPSLSAATETPTKRSRPPQRLSKPPTPTPSSPTLLWSRKSSPPIAPTQNRSPGPQPGPWKLSPARLQSSQYSPPRHHRSHKAL